MKIDCYDLDGIMRRIPHRFENLLLDSVVCEKTDLETIGKYSVTVSNDQPRGIFLETISGKLALIPTVLMEILALASIVCTDYPDDSIIIFASVSQFVVHNTPFIESALEGTVVKLKDKGNFVRCRGIVESNGKPIAEGELMAFIIPKATLAEQTSTPKLIKIPMLGTAIPVDKSTYSKAKAMVMCDSIRVPLESGRLVGEYTYPVDHPLTKGHFPGNPIMMGVLQLLAVEDLCSAGIGLPVSFGTGDCQIVRRDGALIADIKGFSLQIRNGRSHITGTKKVVFRESVRPGDTLYIVIDNLELS